MTNAVRGIVLSIAVGALIAPVGSFAQAPGQAGRGDGRGAGRGAGGAGRGGGRGAGRGGPFAGVPSVSVRGNRQIASEAANILGWSTGVAAGTFEGLTFSDAAAKVDALGSGLIEGSSAQKISAEIPRNLDYNLSADDVAKVKNRLAELRMRMVAYDAGAIPADAASRRKLFEFARELGVQTIVGTADAASLAALDTLATEAGVTLALDNVDPHNAKTALAGRSEHVGLHVDTGRWLQAGLKPADELAALDKLVLITLRDRSAAGPAGRDVPLGTGALGLPQVLLALARLEPPAVVPWPPACADCAGPLAPVKPVFIALAGSAEEAAMRQSLDAYAKAVQPVEGARIDQISKNTPITSTDSVPPLDRLMIQAAVPREPLAPPKKARKLLVIDLCPQGGFYHRTIAHANLALQLIAKNTGAFEPIFSNDLDNLKYPKIKEYDAIFLNSVVGPVFADPEVIGGLTRYVREGGGVAGIHGSTYASGDVPEYGEMMGATAGPHRVEVATLKVDDPNSPLTKQFEGRDFAHVDEFYHFPPTTPYSRATLHVLLSIDTAKSDMTEWKGIRPDNDYGIAWIRSYGQGRVFNIALGHTPLLFGTPKLAQMVFAGIQFVLGDLDADTTPSAKLTSAR